MNKPMIGREVGVKMTGFEMMGHYHHSIDAKGRLFIPARLREELGDTFYVAISTERCLAAYSTEMWGGLVEKVRALPLVEQKKARMLFSTAQKCELDGQGRILLPQPLREYAELKKNVTIAGTGAVVEIWDSDKWAEIFEKEATPENMAAMLKELGI